MEKRRKLDKPLGIDLLTTDTRPIKATKLAIDTNRAKEIAIENYKTGKVTAVAAILKVFGEILNNSRSTNTGKSLSKPNTRLYPKKKGLNRSFKHHGGFHEPSSDASERLIVKQKYYQGIARHRIEW